MSRLNYFILFVVLSILILTKLFDVSISEKLGLSIKNIGLYLVFIVLMISQMGRRSRFVQIPAIVPLVLIFLIAALSIFYAPLFAGGVKVEKLSMLSLYKNEVFDPFFLFVFGFMLINRPMMNAKPIELLAISFGVLNIVALSVIITGVNPFSISVVSHEGTRFASYGGLANQGAYALLFFFPLYFYFYEQARSSKARYFFLVMMLTSLIGVGLTGSRGGYLLTAVLIGFLMFKTKRYKFFLLLMVIGLVGLISYSTVFGIEFLMSAIGRVVLLLGKGEEAEILAKQGITGIDAISAGRTMIWRGIFQVLINDPFAIFIGKGWGTYNAHTLLTEAGGSAAHNVFLKMTLELGLLGLGLMLMAGWMIYSNIKSTLKKNNPFFYKILLSVLFVVVWTFMLSAPINLYAIWSFTIGLVLGYTNQLGNVNKKPMAADLQSIS